MGRGLNTSRLNQKKVGQPGDIGGITNGTLAAQSAMYLLPITPNFRLYVIDRDSWDPWINHVFWRSLTALYLKLRNMLNGIPYGSSLPTRIINSSDNYFAR